MGHCGFFDVRVQPSLDISAALKQERNSMAHTRSAFPFAKSADVKRPRVLHLHTSNHSAAQRTASYLVKRKAQLSEPQRAAQSAWSLVLLSDRLALMRLFGTTRTLRVRR